MLIITKKLQRKLIATWMCHRPTNRTWTLILLLYAKFSPALQFAQRKFCNDRYEISSDGKNKLQHKLILKQEKFKYKHNFKMVKIQG